MVAIIHRRKAEGIQFGLRVVCVCRWLRSFDGHSCRIHILIFVFKLLLHGWLIRIDCLPTFPLYREFLRGCSWLGA